MVAAQLLECNTKKIQIKLTFRMVVKEESSRCKNTTECSFTNLQDKLKFIFKNATVEPMLGCYIIASVVSSLATQNLNLQKACRVNLKFSDEVCIALERQETQNYTREEIAVQQLVSEMIIWKTIVQSSIPALLIIFIGSWSDRTGRRKPVMLIPIIGELFTSIGLIFCTYFFYELPMEVAGLTEAIFPAITGGWMAMFMAVFSYIGDITTVKSRTLRIGVVNVFCSVGIPIGTALSGVLYKELGSYGVYTISSLLYIFSFFYGVVAIPEAKKKEPKVKTISNTAEVHRESCLRKFFNFHHIEEAFAVAFKDDGHSRRLRIILLMVVVIVVMGPMHGEMTVMYLFTRVRFNWDEVNYSIFSTYMMVTNLLGTMFSVGVFSHLLQIDDALIGVMSCMSKILAGFVYAFATTEFVFYLAPIVDIINGTSFIAMRSIISKLVTPDELGKVNSLFGVCEALVPLIYGPMYSYIYRTTLDTMPGAFFLIGGGLTAPAAIIFWWMYTINCKKMKEADSIEAASKQISTISSTMTKPKINSIDFVNANSDFDLSIILDRRTNTHRSSAQFVGVDNRSFQSEKEEIPSKDEISA